MIAIPAKPTNIETDMRAIISDQRKLSRVFRPFLWLLLVLACLTSPATAPAAGPLLRGADSLSAPLADHDFTATLAPKTEARDHLPAPVTAGPPSRLTLPVPGKSPAAALTAAEHPVLAVPVATPFLPRPPPVL